MGTLNFQDLLHDTLFWESFRIGLLWAVGVTVPRRDGLTVSPEQTVAEVPLAGPMGPSGCGSYGAEGRGAAPSGPGPRARRGTGPEPGSCEPGVGRGPGRRRRSGA
ncbi:hypothetical protein AMK22_14600 [Streptomyces sp. CB01580]|nr:hypothetical protein AMK22_14600 [Streptomyces sp. CB01580]